MGSRIFENGYNPFLEGVRKCHFCIIPMLRPGSTPWKVDERPRPEKAGLEGNIFVCLLPITIALLISGLIC